MTDFPFISRISFLKKISSSFKIIRLFVKVDQNIYKKAEESTSMYDIQIPLSFDRLKLSPWFFQICLNVNKTTLRQNWVSKALRFLKMTAEHQDCPP